MLNGEFVIDEYRSLGILGDHEELTDTQYVLAIRYLNEILSQVSSSSSSIVHFSELHFNLHPSKGEYVVDLTPTADVQSEPIIYISEGQVKSSGVPYPLDIMTEPEFYNFARFEQIVGLPKIVALKSRIKSSTIIIYPQPDINYEITLIVKQRLPEFTDNSKDSMPELAHVLIPYLRYKLQKRLAAKYASAIWNDTLESLLQESYEELLIATTDDTQPQGNSALLQQDSYLGAYLGVRR